MFFKRKKAFSLVEISIVMVIVAMIIAGSIGISKSVINAPKTKNSKDKLEEVYKALTNFVANNKRLPCPALPNVVKGSASYGSEATTPGTCDGFTPATSTNLVYGMVPIKALGLDANMAEDGYGVRYSYVVDRRFTRANTNASDATAGFELTQSMPSPDIGASDTPSIISVKGSSGNIVMTNALFVLINHGTNGFGGWNATSNTKNAASSVTDENTNSGSYTGGSSFTSTFVSSSSATGFDDTIIYKNKFQLVKDAGLETIMCNGYEAKPAASGAVCSGYSWISPTIINGEANAETSSNINSGNYCARICGKYGVWGNAYLTTYVCNGCPITNGQAFSFVTYTGASTTLAKNEVTTSVACAANYTTSGGAPSIKCNSCTGDFLIQNNCVPVVCNVTSGATYLGGVLQYNGGTANLSVGQTVNMDCNWNGGNGYSLNGTQPTATCQSNASLSFSNSGSCKYRCVNSYGMAMGTKAQSVSTGTYYQHNQDIVLDCQSGKYYQSGCWSGWCNYGRAVCSDGSWQLQNGYTCRDPNPCNWSGYTATVGKCCHDSNHSCPDCCAAQTVSAQNYNQGDTVCFSGDGGGCSSGFHKARTCVTLNSKTCTGDGNAGASWSGQSGQQDY